LSAKFSYVTLVTNADYALGALALARSLKAVGSEAGLMVLATPEAANKLPGSHGLAQLESTGATIRLVEPLPTSTEFTDRHSRKSKQARSPLSKGAKPVYFWTPILWS